MIEISNAIHSTVHRAILKSRYYKSSRVCHRQEIDLCAYIDICSMIYRLYKTYVIRKLLNETRDIILNLGHITLHVRLVVLIRVQSTL